jgi:hypothetical protein
VGVPEDKICFTPVHSEYIAETDTLWLDLLVPSSGYHFIQSTSPGDSQPSRPVVLYSSLPGRALLAALQTPPLTGGTVLFTTQGAQLSSVSTMYPPSAIFPAYNALVSKWTVQDGSKIPPAAGSPCRYLLLSLSLEDDVMAVIYDAFTDTITFQNKANGAPTHYMLSYSYGLCGTQATRDMVDLSFSSDYSNVCVQGGGLYYQGPNEYHPFPVSCLGVPPQDLLTKCAPVAAKQQALVQASCQASIAKVCATQYTDNPPFSCTTVMHSGWLTVLSLSVSNTVTVSLVLSLLLSFLWTRLYAQYRPSDTDLEELNDERTWGQALDEVLGYCCGGAAARPAKGASCTAELEMARGQTYGENPMMSHDQRLSSLSVSLSAVEGGGGADAGHGRELGPSSSLRSVIRSVNKHCGKLQDVQVDLAMEKQNNKELRRQLEDQGKKLEAVVSALTKAGLVQTSPT